MVEYIDGQQTLSMMRHVAHHVIAHVDMLTDADREIGDGDHGVGMRRAFEAALEALKDHEGSSPAEVFKASGMAIMSTAGGASGALFGTLFRGGAKALEQSTTMDAQGFAAFLAAAQDAIEKRGGAKPGQKTMIDALAPAAEAVKNGTGGTLCSVMADAAAAAKHGVEATRNMLATTGKARSLGERSLGHVDPGALSVSLILEAMANTLREDTIER